MKRMRQVVALTLGVLVVLAGCSGGGPGDPTGGSRTAAAGVSVDNVYTITGTGVTADPQAPTGFRVTLSGRGALRIQVRDAGSLTGDVAFTAADGANTDVDLYVASAQTPAGSASAADFPFRSLHIGTGEERVVLPAAEVAAFAGRPIDVVAVARQPGSFTFRADIAGAPQTFVGGSFGGATGAIVDSTRSIGETRWYAFDLSVLASVEYWHGVRVRMADTVGDHALKVCRPGTQAPAASAVEVTSSSPQPEEVVELAHMPGWADALGFNNAGSAGIMLVGVECRTPGEFVLELAGSRAADPGVRVPRNFALPTAIRGVVYTQRLTVEEGTMPYTFRLAGGQLPQGLQLTGDTVTGTAALTSQDQTFTVAAFDATGESTSRQLSIHCDTPIAPAEMLIHASDADVDVVVNGTHHFANADQTIDLGPELQIGRNDIAFEARSTSNTHRGEFGLVVRDRQSGQVLFQTSGQATSYRYWIFWTRYRLETIGQGSIILAWNGQQLVRQ